MFDYFQHVVSTGVMNIMEEENAEREPESLYNRKFSYYGFDDVGGGAEAVYGGGTDSYDGG